MSREAGDTLYASPLLRLNLGLAPGLELISELEVRPGRSGLTDAALGGKWVPFRGRWSAGAEALLLLPVPGAGGVGVESQLVLTYRDDLRGVRLHMNGGGFADGRTEPAEKGWRGSALVELKGGRYRTGFAHDARDPVGLAAGARPVQPARQGRCVDQGGLRHPFRRPGGQRGALARVSSRDVAATRPSRPGPRR